MASVTQRIKQALAGCGKRQVDLADYFGVSRQAMSNKVARDSWSSYDLIKAAHCCGAKLMIVMADGQQIELEDENGKEEAPGE